MKRFAFCTLVLGCTCFLQPLGAAGKTETQSTSHSEASVSPESVPPNERQDSRTPDPPSEEPDTSAPVPQTEGPDTTADMKAHSDTSVPQNLEDGKESEESDADGAIDTTFASINNKGLTVADGNKWYYEGFDRLGRASFAVLCEDGTVVEKTVWTYKDTARHPLQKKIYRAASSEIFSYDADGKELVIEQYEGTTLTVKTENVYNGSGKLIEQTITMGKNVDKQVWEFAGDTAVTQTKFRNGKKTAFIELHSDPHIVHLYVDEKEVFVGEQP